MKSFRMRYIRYCLLGLLLTSVFMFRFIGGWGEWYACHLYPALSFVLSGAASVVPFSVCEVVVILFVLFLIGYPFYSRKKSRKSVKSILRAELECVLWLYVWFYWAWGMNYFRSDFFQRAHVERVGYNEDAFRSFLSEYADSLNASYCSADTELNRRQLEDSIKQSFRSVPSYFGLSYPRSFQHPKRSLVNPLYSKVGVLGYMGPFFCESHLNHQLFPLQYPFVYAHELSHLLGVSAEAEANYWAFKMCVRSSSQFVRYSGYSGLLPYVLSNAYALLSPEDCDKWVATLRPEVVADFSAQRNFWREEYSPLLGSIQDKLYTLYLKGNKIPTGQKNYAEVVGLLLATSSHDKK